MVGVGNILSDLRTCSYEELPSWIKEEEENATLARGTGPSKHLTVERATSHTEFPEDQV